MVLFAELVVLSHILLGCQVASTTQNVLQEPSSTTDSSQHEILERSLAKFYSVTKRGGSMDRPVLPWKPDTTSKNSERRLYFAIEIEQEVIYQIKLRRNKYLLSRSAAIQELRQDAACMYSGYIIGDPQSTVAINLCNGKGSLISGIHGEYLIEPTSKAELYREEWQLYLTRPKEQPMLTNSQRALIRESLQRSKRSTKKNLGIQQDVQRHIEILVVADKIMVEKYGTEEATTYILTVMNMVSSLFKDRSLGVELNIVLAGLMFLTGNETGLSIEHRADVTLNNFCRWQSSLKKNVHHDHAILMTGVDICVEKDVPCDTIGFAPIRGMCSSTRSCTVNEDRGLGVAFTIAHEIGHNLGMIHDGQTNNCTENGSIMGPSLSTATGTFFWSRCNQKQLADFLETDMSKCLLEDAPIKSEQYNMSISELPGQIYSGDQQCKHLYGSQASVCHFDLPNGVDICRYLWCYVGGMRCETKFLPAAEGTPCDTNKWCRQGQCIPQNQEGPQPIDGGWDNWSEWGLCTRTCDGGVKTRMRYCANPSPRYGGKYCSGDSKEYERCNMNKCTTDGLSFRAQQCQNYNDKPFKGRYFEWSPVDDRYLVKADKCKLYCRAAKYNFFFQMNDKVIDGTRCEANSEDICINGKCQPVGCDGKIWSNAKADKCGVCNGDGSSCETIRGLYSERVTQRNYTTFITIPTGAKNIHIKEVRASSSFVAVKIGEDYLLNGHWSMDWPGKFDIAGAQFVYNRLYSGLEILYSPGPINESIDIQLLAIGGNPGIQYEYVMPIDTSVIRYQWQSRRTSCSQPCGGGFVTTNAVCVSSEGAVVRNGKCNSRTRPISGRFSCNEAPCKARWVVQEWSECSRRCGGGKQRRVVDCMQRYSSTDDRKVKNRYCKGQRRPPKIRRCNVGECLPDWKFGNWSQCSASCGPGMQRRSVYCTSQDKRATVLGDGECMHSNKPTVYQQCEKRKCKVDWHITPWSKCSQSCGEGFHYRKVVCVSRELNASLENTLDTKLCDHIPRTNVALQEKCSDRDQCVTWSTGDWTQCSATCGKSERRRQVLCRDMRGHSSTDCDNRTKPAEVQQCRVRQCESQSTTQTIKDTHNSPANCKDTKSWCPSLARYRYYCTRNYYNTVCCNTCRGG